MSTVLAVNAGSTSVKVSRLVDGADAVAPDDLDAALSGPRPDAVVHRVVHGGDRTSPAVVDDTLVAELRRLTELAPLHQPPALDALDRCRATWPTVQQIACFDTSFHASLPAAARTYALPERWRRRVRVYGFHGISHAWSTARALEHHPAARRVLVAHLGGGQSLCGSLDGFSAVTTMGFTPLDGLVMGTRSGTLDPGALLWLTAHTDEDVGAVLERESGLLGLAGTSDTAELVDRAEEGDDTAGTALDVWTHRFLREAGGCAAVLGGLDVIVFTGGVGENSALIRRRVVDGLSWLGLGLDDSGRPPTDDGVRDLTAPGSSVAVLVVPAREDRQMLHDAAPLLTPLVR
ncbi:acetate/propionate family kinase [Jatrophihabitans endophyticus]|uniref:acetate/propionate family kinase n=1 Tax=Jatrophihabitans endophyticus TaxID=1206085 RepID=UPI0019FB9D86|nr:propionate/acetate kinase [Jatrophihabitans endophyticus]MBE7187293.1 acetate/propionate family kinase [Jatrophihabitans endophyticus]